MHGAAVAALKAAIGRPRSTKGGVIIPTVGSQYAPRTILAPPCRSTSHRSWAGLAATLRQNAKAESFIMKDTKVEAVVL